MTSDQREKVHLSGVKETLLLTLYDRAADYRSPKPILGDRWAAEVLDGIDGYNRFKMWLFSADRYGIVLRASRLDAWVGAFLVRHPDATVLSLGCGLDSRAFRLDVPDAVQWYDVDYPDVVELRRRLYPRRDNYHLISSSVTEPGWLDEVPDTGRPVLVVAEGLLPYLARGDVERLLARITERFVYGEMVFDVIGVPGWWLKPVPFDMWAGPDPHELERMNPRLTLLDDAPVMADYRRIPSRVFRAYCGLLNAFPQLRTSLWLLRFRFGPPERERT
ncbi:MAG: class I SAM-dependent methyltransferase [Streptosporangiales bacterium]|nr:class I SAM-dependent methyltransferase [Streptosporangiales bacterium]